jgi:hypothetical protein
MTAPDPIAEAPKMSLADWGPSIHVFGSDKKNMERVKGIEPSSSA